MSARPLTVAILGPTTIVGRELVPVLHERSLPIASIRLLGLEEEVGETVEYEDESLQVEELKRESFAGVDVVFVPPNVEVPAEMLEAASKAGAVRIDASGRSGDARVIFPGINDEELEEIEAIKGAVIALASASAAQLAAVLLPLEAKAGVQRLEVVSLEAVSNFGVPGMEELSMQTVSLLSGREPERAIFPQRVAFNLIPQLGGFESGGETTRERRIALELGKLLGREVPPLSLTCALVPVFYGTSQFVTIATERPLAAAAAREALAGSESVKLLDEPGEGIYPMPTLAVGDEALHVGRIRETPAGLSLLSVADNLRWGTVVPMVRVVELLREADRI
ncbi:Asd/ArgC dimerization domain-containing protein [Vulgatibacter sp.]|uniref:Asd/ArgC dimerization domain-containing protein n=1 Tax=Vulgatibacter sp. TaxID=1971226 RepID=UPI003567E4EF